uniref:Annexin n=1 Tax=Crassostrea virginica TaxID=6565 RepID=A0A8B8CLB6_CRAVI|nr:annexin A7-like [Crassostrea virginica]
MQQGTIYPAEEFDAEAAAEGMREAMTGFGTSEEAIISILVNHSFEQRKEIATAFKTAYGKGAGTDETVLVEIMTSRTNEELDEIKEIYEKEFETTLEEDLQSDTSGYFGRLMVALCANGREPNEGWDMAEAEESAQKLYEAGAGCLGTEEAEINAILCIKSYDQLRSIFYKYEELKGNPLEEDIASETSGTLKDGFLAIVEVARYKPRFFARRLHDAMAGFGTSDNDLIRLIITRSEDDLEEIKEEYQKLYEKPLAEAVADECSGDYKRILLAIIK